MDGKLLARIGAVVFIAVAVTAAVIQSTRKEAQPAPSAPGAPQAMQDPLRADQRRCQQLGQKAEEDAQCLRVWAETRDRFLGHAPAARSSNDRR